MSPALWLCMYPEKQPHLENLDFICYLIEMSLIQASSYELLLYKVEPLSTDVHMSFTSHETSLLILK